jgi:catalase (peroxidase I)
MGKDSHMTPYYEVRQAAIDNSPDKDSIFKQHHKITMEYDTSLKDDPRYYSLRHIYKYQQENKS